MYFRTIPIINFLACKRLVCPFDYAVAEMPKVDDPDTSIPAILTVEGELNKLASNISIGRDWAGVHYFSDYIESLRMGEQTAIGILQEKTDLRGKFFQNSAIICWRIRPDLKVIQSKWLFYGRLHSQLAILSKTLVS